MKPTVYEKVHDLNGKSERGVFIQKLLTAQINILAKSLDCLVTPSLGGMKERFRRDRINPDNIKVFLGKFRTYLDIPDYLGIGYLVSQGCGTIKRIMDSPYTYT